MSASIKCEILLMQEASMGKEPALREQQYSLCQVVPPSSPPLSYVRMRTTAKHQISVTVMRTIPYKDFCIVSINWGMATETCPVASAIYGFCDSSVLVGAEGYFDQLWSHATPFTLPPIIPQNRSRRIIQLPTKVQVSSLTHNLELDSSSLRPDDNVGVLERYSDKTITHSCVPDVNSVTTIPSNPQYERARGADVWRVESSTPLHPDQSRCHCVNDPSSAQPKRSASHFPMYLFTDEYVERYTDVDYYTDYHTIDMCLYTNTRTTASLTGSIDYYKDNCVTDRGL
uniref:(California timema) hypothetical protein n=1 Tax=Timema californicum TaxID=61474 RepID=A0A7R9IWD6_TIMCA|nr:unnamed protein product [Timema californicum]